MRWQLGRLVLLWAGLLFSTHTAFAIEWTLHGGLKNESAYFIGAGSRWDKVQNRLELKPEAVFSHGWQFRGRALLWYDAAMDILPTKSPDLTPAIKHYYRTASQIKEAYMLYEGDAFDLRLGQQQIVWGKTDGLRMLDIVNPLDMREFILDDFLDSRIGLIAARLNYYPDTAMEQEVELLVIPDVKTAKAAPRGSRWGFALANLPAGWTLQELSPQTPKRGLQNSELGLAWRAQINTWDVSLNYFYGWKDTPNILTNILMPGVLQVQQKYFRMQTLGGSMANAFGAFVVRAEMAVNLGEGINARGTSFADTVQRKTTMNAALALEWRKYHWTLSPQFFIRHINAWNNRLLEARNTGFWTFRIATDFMNEKLKTELLLLADWASGSSLSRPKLSYDWSDHLSSSMGADVFIGKQGFLGQFSSNDRIYMETEYSF